MIMTEVTVGFTVIQNTLRVRCMGAPDYDAITDVTTVINKQNGVSYVLLSFQLLNSNFINFFHCFLSL